MRSMQEALDTLDAAVATVIEHDSSAADAVTRLRALERLEAARRRQFVAAHDLIAGLAHEDPADIGGPVHNVIADWLRISFADVRRRLRDAEQLRSQVTISGETLPPELPATARFWREGLLDPQHLKVIQTFVRDLPSDTPLETVAGAERFLPEQATALRPDQLRRNCARNVCAAAGPALRSHAHRSTTRSRWRVSLTTKWRIKVGGQSKSVTATPSWIPPPHLDHGQPRVIDYHHPERLFDDGPLAQLSTPTLAFVIVRSPGRITKRARTQKLL